MKTLWRGLLLDTDFPVSAASQRGLAWLEMLPQVLRSWKHNNGCLPFMSASLISPLDDCSTDIKSKGTSFLDEAQHYRFSLSKKNKRKKGEVDLKPASP
jgi:hypothetical protein